MALIEQQFEGTDQKFETLFWRKTGCAKNAAYSFCRRTILIPIQVKAAMNYLQPCKVIGARKHHQLAATKITYRSREARTEHLFPDAGAFRVKKYRPSMKRNAVADFRKICRQHRDRSTLITDMVMN